MNKTEDRNPFRFVADRRMLILPLVLFSLSCFSISRAEDRWNADQYPVTGTAPAELEIIDRTVLTFMAENRIPGGVFGLMRNGEILVQRGYGWRDEDRHEPMPPDALLRIASITKPIVAAAVRELIADGHFTLQCPAFALGQSGEGVLPVSPYPGIGDERLTKITIDHLLTHHGGWDRSEAGDLTYREIAAAEALGLESPPGREQTLRWILGQPLQFNPGEKRSYSNIGYLTLGMIIEHVSGQPLIEFVHERVLGPLGVDPADHKVGRTFRDQADSREPFYHHPAMAPNVFDPAGPRVPRSYGGWDHEARVGQGAHISTTKTLLLFLNARVVNGDSIGLPHSDNGRGDWRRDHGGALSGTNANARQRGDGIHFAVIFNKRHPGGPNYGARLRDLIDDLIDEGKITWPE